MEFIESQIRKVNQTNLQDVLFYLSKDPLPCRALNYTLKRHEKCTLYETDDYIESKLKSWGYSLEIEAVSVRNFVADEKKREGYRLPAASDPWYNAYNLYAKKAGRKFPNELIIVLAHKDTPSWLDCAPGAYDNAVGVSASLEIARILMEYEAQRSIWIIFCNEEHWPLTSVTVAQNIAQSEFEPIGVLNLDGLAGKSPKDNLFGRYANVTRFSTNEGEALADLSLELNRRLKIGLNQKKYYCQEPRDDDGSFISAGIPRAVMNTGSFPFAEPNYHTVNDMPENVDLQNLKRATQLSLATVLYLDNYGKCDQATRT